MIALDMWNQQKHSLSDYMERTEHILRLKANHLEDSVPYCLTLNSLYVVPELVKDEKILILKNVAKNKDRIYAEE